MSEISFWIRFHFLLNTVILESSIYHHWYNNNRCLICGFLSCLPHSNGFTTCEGEQKITRGFKRSLQYLFRSWVQYCSSKLINQHNLFLTQKSCLIILSFVSLYDCGFSALFINKVGFVAIADVGWGDDEHSILLGIVVCTDGANSCFNWGGTFYCSCPQRIWDLLIIRFN